MGSLVGYIQMRCASDLDYRQLRRLYPSTREKTEAALDSERAKEEAWIKAERRFDQKRLAKYARTVIFGVRWYSDITCTMQFRAHEDRVFECILELHDEKATKLDEGGYTWDRLERESKEKASSLFWHLKDRGARPSLPRITATYGKISRYFEGRLRGFWRVFIGILAVGLVPMYFYVVSTFAPQPTGSRPLWPSGVLYGTLFVVAAALIAFIITGFGRKEIRYVEVK